MAPYHDVKSFFEEYVHMKTKLHATMSEVAAKTTSPAEWNVAGLERGAARVVSPGPDGRPVLWLEISDEAERVAMQSQVWLSAQVQVVLVRNGVPPHLADKLQVMFASRENTDRLLDGP